MPWTATTAHEHKKGMTDHQAEVWAKVANAALAKCQSDGGQNCDVSAIRQADAAVNNMDSADDGFRFDAGEVIGTGKIDPDTGFLHVEAKVTRTGVLTYRFPDGSVRRELRSPREVFDADSLASLKLRPTTNDHPYKEPRMLVTSENAKRLQTGHLGESIAHDGRWVTAPIVVTDGVTIEAIRKGRRQLSCGYRRNIIWNPGVFEGQAYDCEQVMIRYNHVAHVDSARVGAEASISLDAKDAWEEISTEDSRMVKVVLDGIQYDAAPEVQRALEKAQGEVTRLTTESKTAIDAANAKVDTLQAAVDSSKTEIANLKAQNSDEAIQKRIRERSSLEMNAKRFLASDVKLDSISDAEIRKTVIKTVNKDVVLDGKSDAYIDAAFDYILQLNPTKTEKTATTAVDSTVVTGSAADSRKKMIEGQRDAWKTKTAA